MTKKQRFFITAVIGAFTWAIALFMIFGQNVYTIGASGDWILMEPPRVLVMFITLLATAISFAAWRWYKEDRVDRALSGLNADEKQELRERLLKNALATEDDDYDVVYTPRKRKLTDE